MGAADDLYTKMARSKSGWTSKDLDTLYLGFGWKKREGGSHTVYFHPSFSHPNHPNLMATVTRSRDLPVGYVQTAIKLVRLLKLLEKAAEEERQKRAEEGGGKQ